ncbi:MAG: ABC transporter substrate-binding protein [Candidatus Thorarchaeota archaeon]
MKTRLALLILISITISYNSPVPASAQLWIDDSKNGAYVEKIVYNVIEGDDQQILALQNNEIDLIGGMIDPTCLPTLHACGDIEVANTFRNGYGYLSINTAKNPFNYTAFRRALAFALDKQAISDDAWDGLSEPLDSCVPKINPFSCEGLLDYSYYEADVELGNKLLDDAGFTVDNVTGFRLDPHGNPFSVLIEVSLSSNIAIEVGQKAEEALIALQVDAVCVPTDFYEYFNWHWYGDYDIMFLGSTFSNFDIDWLAYEYWSEFADESYYNFANWRNTTYDSWRDQLLHSTDYQDVYDAAFAMQEIWVHASPQIICYENILLSAYRTDRFEGFVNDVSAGVPGWWTNYKVHLQPGQICAPFGGAFRWSSPLDVDSFNFMLSTSTYTSNVLEMLYDSLMRVGPEGEDILWLAESYTAETHADNPAVPEGHTRFTFDMIQNATWTDGVPLTADDVAYTLNYYRDSPGNPYGPDLSEMTAAYAPTTYRVVIEFNTESYWHLHTVSYKPIIPKHIFLDIGLDGWNTWDPQPPMESMVTSGPYNVSEYVPGEFCELTINRNYFFAVDSEYPWYHSCSTSCTTLISTTSETISVTSTTGQSTFSTTTSSTTTSSATTSSTTTTSIEPTNGYWSEGFLLVGSITTVGSIVVIVILVPVIIRATRHE